MHGNKILFDSFLKICLLLLILTGCRTKADFETFCDALPLLRLEKQTNSSVLVNWEDICTNEMDFVLERKEVGGFKILAELPPNTVMYVDNTVDLNLKSYTYRLTIRHSTYENITTNTITIRDAIIEEQAYPYLIHQPENYTTDIDSSFALLVFLHGSGERGSNLNMIQIHGPPMQIKNGMPFPCIVVSPQCPLNVYWDTEQLQVTIQEIIANNRVDLSRLYLTGLSMGGHATWDWAMAYPNNFAAIMPICGIGDTTQADTIMPIPTWVFHGQLDNIVPVSYSVDMVTALNNAGGEPMFTLYPYTAHDSWTVTYDNPAVYEWLFAQQK